MTLSVADRLDILDVITRADQAASDRDAEAYVQLFTADAVLDGAQGRHAGREALRAAVGPVWAASRSIPSSRTWTTTAAGGSVCGPSC
jgi:hypothetical protein